MSWVAPVTRSAGYYVTSTDWNNIQNNLSELRQGGFALTSQAAKDVMVASSTTQWGRVATANTAIFLTDGSGNPAWSTAALPISRGGTGASTLSNGKIVYTSGGTQAVSASLTFDGTANFNVFEFGADSSRNIYFGSTADVTINVVVPKGTGSGNWRVIRNSDNNVLFQVDPFTKAFNIQGLLSVSGFGTSAFTAGGTAGAQVVQVQNTTDGTTTYAAWQCLNAAGTQSLSVKQMANSWTTSGYLVQGAGVIVETNAAGVSFANTDASADFRFYGGTSITQRWTMFASGGFTIGDTTDPGAAALRVTSTSASAGFVLGTKYTRGGTPAASASTINGSGGAAATVVTLPASSYGLVHVFMKRTGGSVFNYTMIPFVTSGASLAIYTPIATLLGGAQLNFTASGLNLQAKSSEVTAPDSVVYTVEVFAQ